jgi:hypothetical protein
MLSEPTLDKILEVEVVLDLEGLDLASVNKKKCK